MIDICSPSIGPFCGVTLDKTRKCGGRTYRLLVYRAYNAFGLIGSEFNGIAVLNEEDKNVVTDNIAKCSSGYDVPTREQIEEYTRLLRCSDKEFRETVNSSSRNRYEI